MKCVLIFFIGFTSPAFAYFQLELMKSKVSNRQSSQWTLFDWMAQKNNVALMDHWLAMNRSANWFDFDVSATLLKGEVKTAGTSETDQDGERYSADMFISMFNVHGRYERSEDDADGVHEGFGGAVGLRLLGDSSQTTNLVARYGWRRLRMLRSQEEWDNYYAEGTMQLYLVRAFGLLGSYRHYFAKESNKGRELSGRRVSGGAFLEASFLRVFANYYSELLDLASASAITKKERSGVEGGVRLFF